MLFGIGFIRQDQVGEFHFLHGRNNEFCKVVVQGRDRRNGAVPFPGESGALQSPAAFSSPSFGGLKPLTLPLLTLLHDLAKPGNSSKLPAQRSQVP